MAGGFHSTRPLNHSVAFVARVTSKLPSALDWHQRIDSLRSIGGSDCTDGNLGREWEFKGPQGPGKQGGLRLLHLVPLWPRVSDTNLVQHTRARGRIRVGCEGHTNRKRYLWSSPPPYSLVIQYNIWSPDVVGRHVQLLYAPVLVGVPNQFVVVPKLKGREER